MSRYIDADALTAEFHRLTLGENSLIERFFADGIYAVIDTFPTADVAPIIHGRWETINNDCGHYGFVKCTACGDEYGSHTYRYCPNCGAKMDE